jgi:hypothetical protein
MIGRRTLEKVVISRELARKGPCGKSEKKWHLRGERE